MEEATTALPAQPEAFRPDMAHLKEPQFDLSIEPEQEMPSQPLKKSRGGRAEGNKRHSTKSKARPGLRKGKWTIQESKYAERLIFYFKEGLLDIGRGTMLRIFLANELNCEPMRITKRFTGSTCIGKQVYRPCLATAETKARMIEAKTELAQLEKAFRAKVENPRDFGPKMSDSDEDGKREKKSGRKKRKTRANEEANAVGLLLDFSQKAQSRDDESDEDDGGEKKAKVKEECGEKRAKVKEEGEAEEAPKVDTPPIFSI